MTMHNEETGGAQTMDQHQLPNMAPSMSTEDLHTSSGNGGTPYTNGESDEVRTLFISGLPMDCKPRELYLLFRVFKGFESALLKITSKPPIRYSNGYEASLLKVTNKSGKPTSPVGFITFNTRSAAEVAKNDLQGIRFDPDLPQVLRLEFAKSNTKVTKPKQNSPQPAATHPTFIHPLTGQEIPAAALFPTGMAGIFPEYQPTLVADLASPGSTNPAATLLPPGTTMLQPTSLAAQIPVSMGIGNLPPGAVAVHPSIGQTLPQQQAAAAAAAAAQLQAGQVMAAAGNPPAITMTNPLYMTNLAAGGIAANEHELKDLFSRVYEAHQPKN